MFVKNRITIEELALIIKKQQFDFEIQTAQMPTVIGKGDPYNDYNFDIGIDGIFKAEITLEDGRKITKEIVRYTFNMDDEEYDGIYEDEDRKETVDEELKELFITDETILQLNVLKKANNPLDEKLSSEEIKIYSELLIIMIRDDFGLGIKILKDNIVRKKEMIKVFLKNITLGNQKQVIGGVKEIRNDTKIKNKNVSPTRQQ